MIKILFTFVVINKIKNNLKLKIMSGINKVILVGHVGKDPEVRHLETGAAIAKFTFFHTINLAKRNSIS